MRVKICGITREEDAGLAVELGAAALGFVFWPGSPRYVTPERAAQIVRMLPPFVTAVGVFVKPSHEEVRAIADTVGLGAIQYHGTLPGREARPEGRAVIGAVGVRATTDLDAVLAWPEEITVLLDAHDPERVGGTGRTIDWDRASQVAARRRVILSGGLRPDNVARAIEQVRPYAVDVASGVEAGPGIKDRERLEAFFGAVEGSRRTGTLGRDEGET